MIVRTIIVVVVVVLGASHPEPRIFLPVFYIVHFQSYIPTHFHSKDRMILYCREGDHLFFSPKKKAFILGLNFWMRFYILYSTVCVMICVFFYYSIIFQNYGNIVNKSVFLYVCLPPTRLIEESSNEQIKKF